MAGKGKGKGKGSASSKELPVRLWLRKKKSCAGAYRFRGTYLTTGEWRGFLNVTDAELAELQRHGATEIKSGREMPKPPPPPPPPEEKSGGDGAGEDSKGGGDE